MHIARIKVRISSDDHHRTFSSIYVFLLSINVRLRNNERVQLKCICFDIYILHLALSLRLVFL